MPGQIRPLEKIRKVAYKILKTPKELQQDNQPEVSKRRFRRWKIDSSIYPPSA